MEEEEKREIKFMGRNLADIPCFRETFLYSISSGLATGFLYFMMTSRVRRATSIAFGTYGCVTIGYWVHCRYNYSVQKFNMGQLGAYMQQRAVHEGTDMEEKLKGKE